MCEAHVSDVIRKNFDVKKVKANRKKNLATFISESMLNEELIKEKIAETGYKLTQIEVE